MVGSRFSFTEILRRIPYPVEPLGFGRVRGDLLTSLVDRDPDCSWKVPNLNAKINNDLKDHFQLLHVDNPVLLRLLKTRVGWSIDFHRGLAHSLFHWVKRVGARNPIFLLSLMSYERRERWS